MSAELQSMSQSYVNDKRNLLIFYFDDCFSSSWLWTTDLWLVIITQYSSDCDYEYRDCAGRKCSLSSPGYPGIYHQLSKCHYHLQHQHLVRLSIQVNLPHEKM